jgi:hypothetical protein
LKKYVEAIDTTKPDGALTQELGRQFYTKGTLDQRLLPWLWRDLDFLLAQHEDEIEFLLELLSQLGLLTRVSQRGLPLWLLPLRLPVKDLISDAAVQMAQAKFAMFLSRVDDKGMLAGMEAVAITGLLWAVGFINGPDAPTQQVLRAASELALKFADKQLAVGPNPHSLTRDDIAAIHLYTQENPIYGAMNAALRAEDRHAVKLYWGYIKLLQSALFKLPKDITGTLLRGVKVTWMPLAAMKAQLTDLKESGEPLVWWGFSSTSTSMPAVESFLGQDGPRVIFTIDGGSSARDVRRYSAFQDNPGVDVAEEIGRAHV